MRHWRYIGEIIDWNIEKKKKIKAKKYTLFFYILYWKLLCSLIFKNYVMYKINIKLN